MLIETLQGLGMLGLLASHFLLVRGCFGIRESIPAQGGQIAARIDRASDLLDEVAQLISDLGDSTPAPVPAAGGDSPFGMILNSLLSRSAMGQEHGSPQFQGTIYENENDDPTPTTL